jgi:hypothetical protein
MRASLKASATTHWGRLKQCEVDQGVSVNKDGEKRRLIGFSAISVIGFILIHAVNATSANMPAGPQMQRSGGDRTPSGVPSAVSQSAQPTVVAPKAPVSPPVSPVGTVYPPNLIYPPLPVYPPGVDQRSPNEAALPSGASNIQHPSTSPAQPMSPSGQKSLPAAAPEITGKIDRPDTPLGAPPLGPPIEIGPPGSTASVPLQQNSGADVRRLSDQSVVGGIQALLQKKGFLPFGGSGTWDLASREALRDFKAVNSLALNDVLDGQTEEKLSSSLSISAESSFIGRWSPTASCEGNSPDFAPLLINSRRAKSFGGTCEFQKIDRYNGGWRVRAACAVGRNSWIANIMFTVRGSQLIWTSEKGTETYYRCR